MNKNFLLFSCQACINSYKGLWGKVEHIFNIEKDFKNNKVEGFFGYKDDVLYIVFQGTIEFQDWVDNFKFKKAEFKNGLVHKGFLEQYLQIRNIIFSNLNYKKIITTGHSLGGSLATLCAFDIKDIFPEKDVQSVTFGCPRTVDFEFSERYNELIPFTYRVVNGDDLVPKFPKNFMNYCHVGKKVEIGRNKWYKLFSISDHDPRNYLGELHAASL